MIDIQRIRENKEVIKNATAAKRVDPVVVDEIVELDIRRKELVGKIEALRAERNTLSRDPESARQKGKEIKEVLKELEPSLTEVEMMLDKKLREIPNPALQDVKIGKNDTENDVIRSWGEIPKFDYPLKDHLDLGEWLGIIDVKQASKVSGTRFGYLIGDGALLELALLHHITKLLVSNNFQPVIPPTLIRKEVMGGMGYLEHGGEEDMYQLEKDGLVLVGTSEQSIGPIHMDQVLDVNNEKIRYMGFSSCFRREAGSYGKDTRGILRVHQFDKIEMFSFCSEEDSENEHNQLLGIEEQILQSLAIPYRVIKMCTGDLGAPAARKYDLEAWMAGQNTYREVTSTSTCTDFQSRRLNIRYRKPDGKLGFVHMLNGTACAMGRMIIAILENNQQKDGTVKIPSVLSEYMGKEFIQKKKST